MHRVEIAMDYTDFSALARAYNYNPSAFLVALRRVGLTSLALSEQLGANVGDGGRAYAMTGAALLNQARLSPLADPTLATLHKAGKLRPGAVYIGIYDAPTYQRLRRQLPLHFAPASIRILHATYPWLIQVDTQINYFDTVALGIPHDNIALAKSLHLLVIPRFQNDEHFDAAQMSAAISDVLNQGPRVSTVMFFGLRNEVFGYPDHLPQAAALFRAHGARSAHPFNFGTIETYSSAQIQKGNETLAKSIPGQTVRVQAIAAPDLDKITIPEIVARYELGVRERNIRVVYLRPYLHQLGTLSIEATNVAMVKEIANALTSHGFTLGRATPITTYRGNDRILVGIAALAVPSIFVLLLGAFGWYRRSWAIAAYALTVIVYVAGVELHHDIFARSVIALIGALLFATTAFYVLAPAFSQASNERFGEQMMTSLGWTLAATGVALLGALVVIGIMSSPLTMEEIDRFRGVKLLLGLPPLIALGIYLFNGRFNAGTRHPRDIFFAPVQAYQLLAAVVIIGAGVLLLMRSGNQSDIAPSQLELMLRSGLTNVMSVRPRLKEFAIGYPLLMLLPALSIAHRRAIGWLLALGIGVGIGDIIDTFSHLHTPIVIALIRIVNGLVIGIIIGAIVILIYRRIWRPAPCAR